MNLIELSVLPVVLIGMYIYKKDKNKEPSSILIKLFIGGVLSCFLTIFISELLMVFPILSTNPFELNNIDLIPNVFIGTALVEEFSKWIILFIISFKSKHFDESYDMIVYAVFLSLGFACFENILYVLDGGFGVGLLRAVTAVPGHACFGVFMGYYLSKYKQTGKGLFLSLLVPTLMHGAYDYCLFTGNYILAVVWLVFIILMFVKTLSKIRKESAENRNI